MFHIKDDFKAGQPVSAVPASWFNRVAGLLNNLIGTKGVTLTKEGQPPLVAIDETWLDEYLKDYATLVEAGADAPESYADSPTTGSAETAARSDHTHRFQTAEETATSDNSNVQSELDALNKALDDDEVTIEDHETRIVALEDAETQTCDCADKWTAQGRTNETLSTAVDAAAKKANALASVVTNVGSDTEPDYRVDLSKLTGKLDGHGEVKCLVLVDASGNIVHSGHNGVDTTLLDNTVTSLDATKTDPGNRMLTTNDLTTDEIDDLKALVATEDGDPLNLGSGGSKTAGSDTWKKGETEGQGATLNVFTRYKVNGDAVQFFYRKLTISSDGRITSIGAEDSDWAEAQIPPAV